MTRFKKYFYIAAGSICVGLAVLGIFLPLIPTTPLLLLAAACYVRGSERLYCWLLNYKHLGPYIRDFREGRGIPRKTRNATLLVLWLTISLSVLAVPLMAIKILLIIIAAGVTAYLTSLPARE